MRLHAAKRAPAPLLLGFFGITLLLAPWRDIAIQDDAAYSTVSLWLSQGHFTQHPLLLAAAWPQTFLGAGALKLTHFLGIGGAQTLGPGTEATGALLGQLSVLNFTNWLSFGLLLGVFSLAGAIGLNSATEPDLLLSAAFFSFPLFIQYGSVFLSEILACLFLLAAALAPRARTPLRAGGLAFLAAALLGLQRQTLLAFPCAWALALWASDDRELPGNARRPPQRLAAWGWLAGSALSLGIYALLPRGVLQENNIPYFLRVLRAEGMGSAAVELITRGIQMLYALGLFLLPLALCGTNRRWRFALVLQLSFVILLLVTHAAPLATGVLYTDYLPRTIGIGLLSFGAWGLTEALDTSWSVRAQRRFFFADGIAACAALGFAALMRAQDIKYALPPALLLFSHALANRGPGLTPAGRGRVLAYFAIVLPLSLLVNRYSLDTASARWEVAAELLAKDGAHAEEISAGYGWDSFRFGVTCTERALTKLGVSPGHPPPDLAAFDRRVLARSPRLYEDDEVPRYLIKPSRALGFSINLSRNRRPGQDAEPFLRHPYRVFGIPSEIAVFENSAPELAWCDRP